MIVGLSWPAVVLIVAGGWLAVGLITAILFGVIVSRMGR